MTEISSHRISSPWYAYKQLPTLRTALVAHQAKHRINSDLEQPAKVA
jgi:hypothetical protein